jgi:hypothetical protein
LLVDLRRYTSGTHPSRNNQRNRTQPTRHTQRICRISRQPTPRPLTRTREAVAQVRISWAQAVSRSVSVGTGIRAFPTTGPRHARRLNMSLQYCRSILVAPASQVHAAVSRPRERAVLSVVDGGEVWAGPMTCLSACDIVQFHSDVSSALFCRSRQPIGVLDGATGLRALSTFEPR